MFNDAEESGRVRIKICGITNALDAQVALDAGADALGLNCFRQSKRYLDLEGARHWLGKLSPAIRKVAVMVNPSWEEAIATAALPFITSLQLHGRESPDFCARLAGCGVRFAKAIAVSNEESLEAVPNFATNVLVLDSGNTGSFGGSGKTFPWPIARRFVQSRQGDRVILAGGLTPENVAAAIAEVRPFAVDVTSGVESSPGRKDHARLRAFIEASRSSN